MLVLTRAEVEELLDLDRLLDALVRAHAELSAGSASLPPRVAAFSAKGLLGAMPGYLPAAGLGAKLVSLFPQNRAPLPSHQAAILLFDADTGLVTGFMDGTYITAMRTAATAALAARHAAREDARVLAILGTGVQARSHIEALPLVRDFQEIRVWSPNPVHVQSFVAGAARPVRGCSTAADAVRGADVVVLATGSTTPVIQSDWVGPGAHVIGVGACRPNQREMDPALVARATLVVDSRAAAMVEAGDILLAIRDGHITAAHIHAELGEIASGAKPGRRSPDEITIFKSLGLAIEDVVSAGLAYRRVKAAGGGVRVAL